MKLENKVKGGKWGKVGKKWENRWEIGKKGRIRKIGEKWGKKNSVA